MTERQLALLVVEDEALIGLDLEDILNELGHRVVDVVGTVGRALEFLEDSANHIDAALLDANLGGTSSLPIAERLLRSNIPFIVTSGYSRHEVTEAGFDAPCVVKPYAMDDIRRALQRVANDFAAARPGPRPS